MITITNVLSAGLLCGLGLGLWGGISLSARSAGSRDHPAQGRRLDGRQLFTTYCASCHGATGVGNGPAAPSLRRPPPDLTGLALANGDLFPAERVRRIIDGREVDAHGNREMPVWGDAFKAYDRDIEDEVRARIAALVQYLTSIQRRRA